MAEESPEVIRAADGAYETFDDQWTWRCAVGLSHTPDHPEGTSDGLATCTGCANDVWVGYPKGEQEKQSGPPA